MAAWSPVDSSSFSTRRSCRLPACFLPAFHLHQAEVESRFGVPAIQLHRCPQLSLRAREVARARQREAQGRPHNCTSRVDGGRLVVERERVDEAVGGVELPCLVERRQRRGADGRGRRGGGRGGSPVREAAPNQEHGRHPSGGQRDGSHHRASRSEASSSACGFRRGPAGVVTAGPVGTDGAAHDPAQRRPRGRPHQREEQMTDDEAEADERRGVVQR